MLNAWVALIISTCNIIANGADNIADKCLCSNVTMQMLCYYSDAIFVS